VASVHATYFTDPACPWSWSIEPARRRLEVEFGEHLELSYAMGGIEELAPAPQEALEWLEASAASGMPVDARLWLEGGPTTSYPACTAVKAAAEQGLDGAYLRRVREGLGLRRRRLDHAEAFVAEAREVAGMDVERFRIDLRSHAILEAFGADLERARAVDPAHHSEDRGRVKLPSIELRGEDGAVHGVYGPQPYEAYRDAAVAAGAPAPKPARLGVEEALRRFGSLATAEVAAVCGRPGPRAAAELWRLASEWVVRPERAGGGELWSLA
jgi:predicted DsbA family dithiol-disulfide isomerase